jgi:hypothetical protein
LQSGAAVKQFIGAFIITCTVTGVIGGLLVQAEPAHGAVVLAGDDQGACQARNQNIVPWLRAQGATWMRVGFDSTNVGRWGGALNCIQSAYNAGIRIYLAFNPRLNWTPAQDAAWLAHVLPEYGRFASAISVGRA